MPQALDLWRAPLRQRRGAASSWWSMATRTEQRPPKRFYTKGTKAKCQSASQGQEGQEQGDRTFALPTFGDTMANERLHHKYGHLAICSDIHPGSASTQKGSRSCCGHGGKCGHGCSSESLSGSGFGAIGYERSCPEGGGPQPSRSQQSSTPLQRAWEKLQNSLQSSRKCRFAIAMHG